MTNIFQLTYSDEFLRYSLGDQHPMNPRRLGPIISLMNDILKDKDEFIVVGPNPVKPSILGLAHSNEYIALMNEFSSSSFNPTTKQKQDAIVKYGLGSGDCPIFEDMSEISEIIVGSTVSAAEELLNNKFSKAFVLLAGLHHASRERASGFCYYNDINVTIHRLKKIEKGIKILYLDTDLHAGDGVNYEFYDDPSVLTISLHESGKFLFPGNCFSEEIGHAKGEGYAVNLPLIPYTYDELYKKAINDYLPPLMETFDPDFVIWQAGVDGHAEDPLGHLLLTTNTYSYLGSTVKDLIDNMNTTRFLMLGGGGYNPVSVTKSWLSEICNVAGILPIKYAPETWIEHCRKNLNVNMPKNLEDSKININKLEHAKLIESNFLESCDNFEKNLSKYWAF